MSKLKLKEHPRLYVDADTVANLNDKLHSPFLRDRADEVLAAADKLVRTRPLTEEMIDSRYAHFTRRIDTNISYLTTAWVLTKKGKYRKAVMKRLATIAGFNQISCEANRSMPASHEMWFCLSYGEFSCTVGRIYDLFRKDLSEDERDVFFKFLDRFLMKEALKCLKKPPWWAYKEWSNWNGVCSGGMGVMALAFYDDHPDAKKLIPFVEESIAHYFRSFVTNGGGTHEGAGYWRYAMCYAMRYLLSWEAATGKKHPAFNIKELGKSLSFAVDFQGISFGDSDNWAPNAFFFQAAKRFNNKTAAMNAAMSLLCEPKAKSGKVEPRWPNGGEVLLAADFIPTEKELDKIRKSPKKKPVARIYQPLGWAVLADDEECPSMRMAVRGGSSKIKGHGMMDLLSIRCRVNRSLMVTDQQDGFGYRCDIHDDLIFYDETGYLPTAFSKRGHESFGRSAGAKSTILIDGVGHFFEAECKKTEVVKGSGILGIRVDATGAYLKQWGDKFIGRLVLMVDNEYWLVIDRIEPDSPFDNHWMESRYLTFAETKRKGNRISFKCGKELMQFVYTSLERPEILDAVALSAKSVIPQATIHRCMDHGRFADNMHVVAMHPGSTKLGLKLRKENRSYLIEITKPGAPKRTIKISSKLRLLK